MKCYKQIHMPKSMPTQMLIYMPTDMPIHTHVLMHDVYIIITIIIIIIMLWTRLLRTQFIEYSPM